MFTTVGYVLDDICQCLFWISCFVVFMFELINCRQA